MTKSGKLSDAAAVAAPIRKMWGRMTYGSIPHRLFAAASALRKVRYWSGLLDSVLVGNMGRDDVEAPSTKYLHAAGPHMTIIALTVSSALSVRG
jgi:hypothetical protein